MFELPALAVADILDVATEMFADVFPLVALLGGILLAVGIAGVVIEWVKDAVIRSDRITPEGVQAQEDAGLFDFDE